MVEFSVVVDSVSVSLLCTFYLSIASAGEATQDAVQSQCLDSTIQHHYPTFSTISIKPGHQPIRASTIAAPSAIIRLTLSS